MCDSPLNASGVYRAQRGSYGQDKAGLQGQQGWLKVQIELFASHTHTEFPLHFVQYFGSGNTPSCVGAVYLLCVRLNLEEGGNSAK